MSGGANIVQVQCLSPSKRLLIGEVPLVRVRQPQVLGEAENRGEWRSDSKGRGSSFVRGQGELATGKGFERLKWKPEEDVARRSGAQVIEGANATSEQRPSFFRLSKLIGEPKTRSDVSY